MDHDKSKEKVAQQAITHCIACVPKGIVLK